MNGLYTVFVYHGELWVFHVKIPLFVVAMQNGTAMLCLHCAAFRAICTHAHFAKYKLIVIT